MDYVNTEILNFWFLFTASTSVSEGLALIKQRKYYFTSENECHNDDGVSQKANINFVHSCPSNNNLFSI